jgi:hypothetical protein
MTTVTRPIGSPDDGVRVGHIRATGGESDADALL